MRDGLAYGLGVLLLATAGCGAEGVPSEYRGGDPSTDGIGSEGGGSMGSSSRPGGGTDPQPGTLTAGAWDDNRNFEHFTAFLDENAETGALTSLTRDEHEAAHARFAGDRDANERLDIALVLDTTGSMGDEITYLQSELDAIAEAVDGAYPGADARWALIAYRDEGDEYVTRVFDFRDVGSIRSDLAAQSAGGGGDYPEASHTALNDMTNLDWRDGADVARVAFWVADAPHHHEVTDQLTEAIRTAAQLDVHVYPVASSGVDIRTEASMRSAAQLTGGRYLFLTDDSGVGGTHLEPSVPCYFVTLLSHAMLRMVDIEMSGVYREPVSEQVIRTGGDPSDGACVLEDGSTVLIF